MTNTPALDALRELGAGGLADTLDACFDQMAWCEEEIESAKARHPEASERIWASFKLLHAQSPLMDQEVVYRGHCRELLDRVAAGEDTREATNAEMAGVLSQFSLEHPLNAAASTLYMRVFVRAFPDKSGLAFDARDLKHEERMHGSEADDLERQLRRKARVADRTLEVTS